MPRDARIIGKVTRVGDLYDFYGALLTERQRELVELHYADDWSLTEIAEHLGISRQAVHDHLRRAEEQLEAYERTLGLVAAHHRRRQTVQQLAAAWTAAKPYVPDEPRAQVERWLDALLDEYR
jgi:predicted DNA-binding protein YlxM (UPF0122 family)